MIPPKLKEAYRRGNFGVFIGAGLSQASGLPNWETLLRELIDIAFQNTQISSGKRDELWGLISDPSKYLLVAEELKEVLHADLHKFIRAKFDDSTLLPSETLKKVITLKSRFFITTNYDTLIEKSFVMQGQVPNDLTYKDAATINDNLLEGRKFILKAHGDARRAPNEIVITEKDYRNIIYREPGYQSVIQSVFSMCNILFLGVSLSDPELRLLLGYIHNIFHGGSPSHFALMNRHKITETEIERWRKDFNITILTYSNHDEIKSFVDDLLTLDSLGDEPVL